MLTVDKVTMMMLATLPLSGLDPMMMVDVFMPPVQIVM